MITASTVGLTSAQFAHAQAITAAVKARGLPARAVHLALACALTESGLWMYANGNNPRSLQLPHDRVGWDHGSVGLFQQQVGGAANSTANWGTTDQLMNVGISTGKFLDALGPVSTWQDKTNWAAIQDVQHSIVSDGSNYERNDAQGIRLGNVLWGAVVASTGKAAGAGSHGITAQLAPGALTYNVRPGDTLSTIADKVGTDVPNLVALNRGTYPSLVSNPDYIQVGWVLRLKGSPQPAPSSPVTPSRIYVVQPGDNLTLIARHYPSPSITWQSIARVNHLPDPNHIVPGQRLVIA